MTRKRISRCICIGMLILLGSGFFSAYSVAKDASPKKSSPEQSSPENSGEFVDIPLLDGAMSARKQYLVKLSGTVMNETFSGVQALLTLMAPVPNNKYGNPYLLVIEGYPKQNSVNSFFWGGDGSEMKAISNQITCDIKRTFVKEENIYFLFLSPALLRLQGGQGLLANADEQKKEAEKVALPTSIRARAGQLKLRIHSSSVSGTVWMKGYDQIEKAFVLYSARLYGNRVFNIRPKSEQKKITPVRE